MDIPAKAGRFSALSSHPMAKGSTALLAQDPQYICEVASPFFFFFFPTGNLLFVSLEGKLLLVC